MGSGQLAIGSLQLAVCSGQLAEGNWVLDGGIGVIGGRGFIIEELIFWELLFIWVEFIGWNGF